MNKQMAHQCNTKTCMLTFTSYILFGQKCNILIIRSYWDTRLLQTRKQSTPSSNVQPSHICKTGFSPANILFTTVFVRQNGTLQLTSKQFDTTSPLRPTLQLHTNHQICRPWNNDILTGCGNLPTLHSSLLFLKSRQTFVLFFVLQNKSLHYGCNSSKIHYVPS